MSDIRSQSPSWQESLRVWQARDDSILHEYAEGVSQGLLAERYDMKRSAVGMVIHRAAQRGDERAFARLRAPPAETRASWVRSAQMAARRESILEAWGKGELPRVIAERLGITRTAVKACVKLARGRGDQRAAYRSCLGRPRARAGS